MRRAAHAVSARDGAPAHERVERHGDDQHDRGGDVLTGIADAHQAQTVEHRGDDDPAQQSVQRLPAAAEQAGSPDHCGGHAERTSWPPLMSVAIAPRLDS